MSETNAVARQKKIVEILQLLHKGGDFEEAKRIFDATFDGVDVAEITSAERELIATGLNPMEIQTLCNVHAAVFRGKIRNGEKTPTAEIPGHPVQVMKLENVVLMSLINDELLPTLKKWQQGRSTGASLQSNDELLGRLKSALKDLLTIDLHYQRKENLIFPLMDQYGITAPPKVMWGVDDEIRGWIKDAYNAVSEADIEDPYVVERAVEKAAKEVDEMVFKEEEIMLPMILEVFTPADWGMIAKESGDIGYTLIATPLPWQPTKAELAQKPKPSELAKELNKMAEALAASQNLASSRAPEPSDQDVLKMIHKDTPMPVAPPSVMAKIAASADEPATDAANAPHISVQPPKKKKPGEFGANTSGSSDGHIEIDGTNPARIVLPTGSFNLDQLTNVLRVLPFDMTFVDHNDTVRWFSDSAERVFPRTRAVIGRQVQNCHPPKSVDRVQKILDDFHAGRETHADFWFEARGHKMYVRYFAVTTEEGVYLGCLEVTQDIGEIQALTGEKRL